MDYDLVLTGCMADDDWSAQVGVTLAEMLEIPHAALVVSTELEDDEESMTVHRELEGGLHEVLEIELPALLTIQTGINEPRYASIFGIRKAMKKAIEVLDLDDLELAEDAVGEAGSKTSLVKLFIPVVTAQATILEGSPEEVSGELVTVLKNEGVV
jgi:electron transfer flavoprotein beta subunit